MSILAGGRPHAAPAAAAGLLAAVIVCALAAPAVASRSDARRDAASVTATASTANDPHRMDEFTANQFEAEAAALPDALAVALDRDLGIDAAQYLAEAAAASDAVQVIDSLGGGGADVTSARLDGTELVVSVDSDADRDAAIRAGARVEDAPAPPDLSAITFTPAFDVNGGEGYAWTNSDGTSRQCSIGVTGFRISDGRPMALTAGHCVAGMSAIRGGVRQLIQGAAGSGGNFGQVIGSPGTSAFGNGFDGALIALDGAGATPRPGVLTWGGGSGAPRSSAPVAITGQSATIVGANLCKSGSRTGWTCGTVKAVDSTVNVGGNQVNSILASTCIQPGDSGGAALTGQTVIGVNSSTSSAPCGDANYISAFFPMISSAGKASVQSQLGSAWEPAFTVSIPTLDSIAVGDSGAAVRLSGRVTSSSSRSTVELRIDGASVPAMTVPVSSGSWTADLSRLTASVPAGSHRISAIAVSGAWSRSAAIETTVLVDGSPAQVVGALLPAEFVER